MLPFAKAKTDMMKVRLNTQINFTGMAFAPELLLIKPPIHFLVHGIGNTMCSLILINSCFIAFSIECRHNKQETANDA